MLKKTTYLALGLIAPLVASMYAEDGATATVTAESKPVAVKSATASSDTEMLEMLGYITVFQSGMKELGFGPAEAEAIARGLKKGLTDEMPDPALQSKMAEFQVFVQARATAAQEEAEKAQAMAAEANITEGLEFFKGLAEEEGIESTESGLYYKIAEPGSETKPTMEDAVLVHYKGTLIDGTQFDSSYDRGEPATFPLNGVVKGFGEGLTKIGEGGKITLYIPSDLGYGNSPRPGGPIQPGSTLIFECELIEINPGASE